MNSKLVKCGYQSAKRYTRRIGTALRGRSSVLSRISERRLMQGRRMVKCAFSISFPLSIEIADDPAHLIATSLVSSSRNQRISPSGTDDRFFQLQVEKRSNETLKRITRHLRLITLCPLFYITSNLPQLYELDLSQCTSVVRSRRDKSESADLNFATTKYSTRYDKRCTN